MESATAAGPSSWQRVKANAPQSAALAITGAGAMITSAISYQHEYALARRNGQVEWVSLLLPFSLDGMILVAGVALAWAAMNYIRGWARLWQPRLVLAAGILVTIAANFVSDLRLRWLGPAVSASSGVALVLMSAVAFWLLAEQRRIARGDDPQPSAGCSCPPPPVSLAEALPLARSRLIELGEPHGEMALADRFSVTRHQVRTTLGAPAVPQAPQNGGGPGANGPGAP